MPYVSMQVTHSTDQWKPNVFWPSARYLSEWIYTYDFGGTAGDARVWSLQATDHPSLTWSHWVPTFELDVKVRWIQAECPQSGRLAPIHLVAGRYLINELEGTSMLLLVSTGLLRDH